MQLSDKLVLVTGGSSGIGKQVATDLLKVGARVIIVSNYAERLSAALSELSAISPNVYSLECDVGNAASVTKMAGQVLSEHGCPDILINNAGFATYRTFEATSMEEMERLVSVNMVGAMRCAKAFLPAMIERRSGRIVNMASVAGRLVITPHGTYSAAKHGMVAWSETLMYELARFNIKVSVVCPGRVETPFFEHETFQSRSQRAETRYTITLKDVSRVTLQAIIRNRFLSYVPWTFGMAYWLLNTFPFVFKPIYGKLITSRINTLYKR